MPATLIYPGDYGYTHPDNSKVTTLLEIKVIFDLLHEQSACKLGQLADHARHVQYPKLGFSLVALPGETERPFDPDEIEVQ